MTNQKIRVIDDTLREGMQYRGLMFSCEQRLKILEFQERLGIDICRAGYPSAHKKELDIVKTLADHAKTHSYQIQVAAMGRALKTDVEKMLDTGASQFHLHSYIKADSDSNSLKTLFDTFSNLISLIKTKQPDATICAVMMDLGKTNETAILKALSFFKDHPLDIISLADTSGIMTPSQVSSKMNLFSKKASKINLSIHCHNDLGMASANSFMGVAAGASIFEASVFGIGERNGIADLYTTALSLKNQGFNLNVNIDDVDGFNAYYDYVDSIVYDQQNSHLLNPNTPFFGEAVKSHVAGTHAADVYADPDHEILFLNSLCGKHLVKRFIDLHGISCAPANVAVLTNKIKEKSYDLNRCLTPDEVRNLATSI